MKSFKQSCKIGHWILQLISGWNQKKYWKRKYYVQNVNKKGLINNLWKLYFLFYIKKKDYRFGCSFGTNINCGSKFATPPILPHGPKGIIVGSDVIIGKKCIIYHQVTIAAGNVVIGDYCEIGAGAKILPNVKIGSHCHVGANAVVVQDMPDYSTCVMQKPRIILKNNILR